MRRGGRGSYGVGVERLEDLAEIAEASELGGGDGVHSRRQPFPQAVAHDLELNRLDPLARRPVRCPGATVDEQSHEVVDERLGNRRSERAARACQRARDRSEGTVATEGLEPVPRAQPAGQPRGQRVEVGDVVLADGENDPQRRVVGEGVADAVDEVLARGPAVRKCGEELLELVDDDGPRFRIALVVVGPARRLRGAGLRRSARRGRNQR